MLTTDHRPYRAKQLFPENPIWHLMRADGTLAATFWGRDSCETEARLAARAMNVLPDLLAACEDMAEFFRQAFVYGHSLQYSDGRPVNTTYLTSGGNKAIAAIAKAEEVDDE